MILTLHNRNSKPGPYFGEVLDTAPSHAHNAEVRQLVRASSRGGMTLRLNTELHNMIYDITPPIDESLKVWPGDTPVTREVLCDMHKGDNLTLSTLHATVHLGAHTDAPSHYGVDAPTIDERSLDMYIGPCEVVRIHAPRGARFGADSLPHPPRTTRVLFATGSYPDPSAFHEDFAALAPALVDHLADHGVRLVGIDTPSVDLFDSKDLPSHNAVLRHDMAILEGLRLEGVPEGVYELIALPLPLVGFDASPVRAVLRDLPGGSSD